MTTFSYKNCVIIPKLALIGGDVVDDVAIFINDQGTIQDIKKASTGNFVNQTVVQLPDEILLPGFINAHSHAFHRHLRGRSEIGGKAADTFWKWRDNMYGLVDGVTKEMLYEYCRVTFLEMLSAGITTVGEFHYVHHSADGRFDLDSVVIQAAQDVGIRLTLIQTLYERAGFDNGIIHPVQNNFFSSYEEFMTNMNKLMRIHNSDTVSIAVAAHSTRGVCFENIAKLYEYSKKNGLAFHIHLEEQPKEIQDCLKYTQLKKACFTDLSPSDILFDLLDIGNNFTSVHSTYTSPPNMKRFAQQRANVCICPLTEGYLGDGIPFVPPNLDISLGTDCNNRICFLEEMRWACYSQHMKMNSRSVAGLSAQRLVEAATIGGARSLCLEHKVGTLEVGKQFDCVSFELSTCALKNCQETQEILDSLVFGCGNREIKRVIVNGINRYIN